MNEFVNQPTLRGRATAKSERAFFHEVNERGLFSFTSFTSKTAMNHDDSHLDLTKLERVKRQGSKMAAQCPACAEAGLDRAGNHLVIFESGKWGCVVNPGAAGAEHRKRIWEVAGKPPQPSQRRPLRPAWRPRVIAPVSRIPALRQLTVGEMAAIAQQRGWQSFAGLEILGQRGLIWFGLVYDDGVERPAWIITDSTRKNADARRIDGGLWTFKDGGQGKAKSLVSGARGWPIGAGEIGERPLVLLCEGQPDFCAGPFVAWFEGVTLEFVAFTCITGSGNAIDPAALPLFAGKHVRIAVHDDPKGQGMAAAERWARQLFEAGAGKVDWFDFRGLTGCDGKRVTDLADFAKLLDDEFPPSEHMFDDIVHSGRERLCAAIS